MSTILTRMGDGYSVELSPDELRRDVVEGSEDAARRAGIPVLDDGEVDYLVELFAYPGRITGVERGHEVVLTKDGCANTLYNGQMSSGVGVPLAREQGIRIFERAFCFDTMEVGHPDYSFKPAKPLIALERMTMEQALLDTIVPLFYGAMPNMGLYFQPDGPFRNPADLLPRGLIAEARETQLEAAAKLRDDMILVGSEMAEAGADGIDFDTTASAGDAEFLATLEAVERLAGTTDLAIEVGMATELVLGFHGEVEYRGTRLAGLWPHQQVKVVEQAGGHIFGPVATTHTGKSAPWNVARATTFVKECSRVATHPGACQRGHGGGWHLDGRGPAQRRVDPCRRGAGRDRSGGRLVGGRRRSLGDVAVPRPRLWDGRHQDCRRSGSQDAAPRNAPSGGETLRGERSGRRSARLDRFDGHARPPRRARHRRHHGGARLCQGHRGEDPHRRPTGSIRQLGGAPEGEGRRSSLGATRRASQPGAPKGWILRDRQARSSSG